MQIGRRVAERAPAPPGIRGVGICPSKNSGYWRGGVPSRQARPVPVLDAGVARSREPNQRDARTWRAIGRGRSIQHAVEPGLLAREIGIGVVQAAVALPVAADRLAAQALPRTPRPLVAETREQLRHPLLVLGLQGAAELVRELVRRVQTPHLVAVRGK